MINRWLPLLLSRGAAVMHDLLWVPAALALAFLVHMDVRPFDPGFIWAFLVLLGISIPVQAIAFTYFGLYRGIWRFASVPDVIRILRAVWIGAAISVVIFSLIPLVQASVSTLLLYPVFLTMGLTGPRLFYRWYKDHMVPLGAHRRALLVGAGRSGESLVRELINSREYLPVGFVDEDPKKLGRELHGVRVLGSIDQLEYLLRSLEVDIVLIAMPSASPGLMRNIVDRAAHAGVSCVTLPSLQELTDGRVEVARLREVEIQDLLGREVITLDDAGLNALFGGKRVMVTGAGGSIGSELCRQVAHYQPTQIVMLDHAEFGLYSIEHEMRDLAPGVALTPLLGDVVDEVRMRHVFSTYRPEIVLHAAAYKHVPLVEGNVIEGTKANALGTSVLADLAAAHGCQRFVLVSTDKAVAPTNVMGASKRVAELYCQKLSRSSKTAFIVTRFGNVMGSTGSVVPLFRQQIAAGGPVTVTHEEITRYFMTIPEAVSLILQAAAMGQGGETFVLDMGKPIRIRDLAAEMIRLSGHEPGRDIDITFIGLRPGEKLHEDLFHDHENPIGTAHPKILQARPRELKGDWLESRMLLLQRACATHNEPMVRSLLQEIVPEYRSSVSGPVALPGGQANLKIVSGAQQAP